MNKCTKRLDSGLTTGPTLVMSECLNLTFKSVDQVLLCYHLNETFLAELLNGTIYF